MALQFIESFSSYGTNANLMLNGRYASINFPQLVTDPDPLASGTVLQVFSDTAIRRVLSGSRTRVGQVQKVWMPTLPFNANNFPSFAEFRNSANVATIAVGCDTTGRIEVRYGANLSLSVTSSAPVMVANTWQQVEVIVDFSVSSGAVFVYVNGEQIALPPVTNTGVECSQVVKQTGNGFTVFFKDFVVYDGLGGDVTGPLGLISVVPLPLDSDQTFNWATTGANGFSVLNQRPPVDTQRISAGFGPFPAPAVFGLSNVPANTSTILGVQVSTRSAKSDSGDGTLQVAMRSGAAVATGAARTLTTAFTYRDDVFPLDPATGARWTAASLNAALVQLDRVA